MENGRPVTFEWTAPGPPTAVSEPWSGVGAPGADTLRFDGSGRATVWLPPGEYRYRLSGGGGGTVAVEEYSEELLPRPVMLREHAARGSGAVEPPGGARLARLFGLCVLGLAGEWIARRRLGLR